MAAKNIELIDQNNRISIKSGTELSLTVRGLDLPLNCIYVGDNSDQYIVITPPENIDAVEKDLLQSEWIKINYALDGNILQFTSKLTEITSKPLKLLILEYPSSVDIQELRSQKRINCFISAEVEINDHVKAGVIKNISKRGCRCVFDLSDDNQNMLRIDDCIVLSFCFPGIADKQEIEGKVKDIQIKEKQLEIGLEFASIAWWVPPYD